MLETDLSIRELEAIREYIGKVYWQKAKIQENQKK
jgi:hypothetical protein